MATMVPSRNTPTAAVTTCCAANTKPRAPARDHEHAADGAHQRLVREARAHRLPVTMPRPNSASTKGTLRQRQPGHLGERRLDVAEDREHAAEADGADAEREPHVLVAQRLQFAPWAGTGRGGDVGHARGARARWPAARSRRRTRRPRASRSAGRAHAAIGTPASVAPVRPSITRPTALRTASGRRERCGHQRRDAEAPRAMTSPRSITRYCVGQLLRRSRSTAPPAGWPCRRGRPACGSRGRCP
jgi:hypothetical protein